MCWSRPRPPPAIPPPPRTQECAADLAAAKPIVDAALAALNQLDKGSLTELKSMGKPPDDVVVVAAAVMVLMADPKKIPKDRSWASAKKMMANVTGVTSV